MAKMYIDEIDRLLTVKNNFNDSLKKLKHKLDSKGLSHTELKKLNVKVEKYELKIKKIDIEIENLTNKKNLDLIQEQKTNLNENNTNTFTIKKIQRCSKENLPINIKEFSCFGNFDRIIKVCKKCDYRIQEKCIKKTIKIERKQFELDYGPMNKVELVLLLIGVFIVSFSVLIFEISLTRIFSVMLTYHYTFVVVSFAILGLGLGGIVLHFAWNKIPLERKGFNFLMIITLIFSVSVPLLLATILFIPYIDSLAFYIFIMIIPFIIAGIIFAFIFKQFTNLSSKVYGIDLIGAGTACVIVILLFETIGGINSILLIGSIIAVGGLSFAIASKKDANVGISLIIILLLSLGFFQNYEYNYLNEIPLSNSPNKELSHILKTYGDDINIVETRWSVSGRTDLISLKNEPDVMYIFIDAAAPTPMYRFNGNINDTNNEAIRSLPYLFGTYFGFLFGEKNDVLIIGAGGGQDVLIALQSGAKNITAVEVNQATVDIMNDYSWFNGGLYSDFDNINVVVDEGRSFLKHSNNKYDTILISIPITKTSGSASGYSLAENYLFTQESFEDYFEHLTDNGRLIIIPHHLPEVYKLTTTVLTFFNNIGKNTKEAMQHILIAGPQTDHDMLGSTYPAFIVKKTAYSPQEGKERHDIAMEIGYSHLYTPPEKLCNMVDDNLYSLANGVKTLDDFILYANIDLQPSTDDRPFFYKIDKGLPESLRSLGIITSMIIFAVILIPFTYKSHIYRNQPGNIINSEKNGFKKEYKKNKNKKNRILKNDIYVDANIPKFIFYFSLIGLGFMLIEVSLIQKFILFLGKPALSLSATLFSILIGGGIGSLFSYRLMNNISRKGALISLIIGFVVVIYVIILPYIIDLLLGIPITNRIIISGVILFPLGFLLGIMLPLGMMMLELAHKSDHIPWMWGINGTTSVMGSVLAIIIAISFGYSFALIAGAFAYFLIFLTFR
jgi:hypothetical protein